MRTDQHTELEDGIRSTGRMLAFSKRFRSLILRGSNEESKGADTGKSADLMAYGTHTKSN